MSRTILTYQPYIYRKWHHITLIIIVNELLILVTQVATISWWQLLSFMKSIDKMLHMKRSFLLLKFQMFFRAGQKDMTKIFKKTVK